MKIAETCPKCGAERLSWMGNSHYRTCPTHGRELHARCCDGLTADEFWGTWVPPTAERSTWRQR